MKQQYAWAVIDARGRLALWDGRCPIYWQRNIAYRERNARNRRARDDDAYQVVKVTIAEVYKPR